MDTIEPAGFNSAIIERRERMWRVHRSAGFEFRRDVVRQAHRLLSLGGIRQIILHRSVRVPVDVHLKPDLEH